MAETLLQMTQDILSALGSDEVDSISDTVESYQVATIIKNKYLDMLYRGDFVEHERLFQLTDSTDPLQPTLMTIPEGIGRINWIKYFDDSTSDTQGNSQFGAYSHGVNTDITSSTVWTTTSSTSNSIGTGHKTFTVASSDLNVVVGQNAIAMDGTNTMFGTVVSYSGTTLVLNITNTIGTGTFSDWIITNNASGSILGYKYVTILPFEQFLDMINRFNPFDNNVGSFTFTEDSLSYTFYYKNNIQPSFATVLSNNYVFFDSYNNLFDDTVQGSKTLCYGQVLPTFTMSDSFIPDLDDQQFPLLFNEAKSLAFFEIKQMPHPKADLEIRRQWGAVQKNKSKDNKPSYFDQLANFGRVPRTGGYASGGYGAYKWMRQASP